MEAFFITIYVVGLFIYALGGAVIALNGEEEAGKRWCKTAPVWPLVLAISIVYKVNIMAGEEGRLIRRIHKADKERRLAHLRIRAMEAERTAEEEAESLVRYLEKGGTY